MTKHKIILEHYFGQEFILRVDDHFLVSNEPWRLISSFVKLLDLGDEELEKIASLCAELKRSRYEDMEQQVAEVVYQEESKAAWKKADYIQSLEAEIERVRNEK